MTTFAQARAALATAVGANDRPVAPPGCQIYSNGSDLEGVMRGQTPWGFRVACYVGYRLDDASASLELAAYVAAKLNALNALEGWEVGPVSGDVLRTIAGGEHLSADISVRTMIDI